VGQFELGADVVDLEDESHPYGRPAVGRVRVVSMTCRARTDGIAPERHVRLWLAAAVGSDVQAKHSNIEVGGGVEIGREDLEGSLAGVPKPNIAKCSDGHSWPRRR
jgi:hypothetical protein